MTQSSSGGNRGNRRGSGGGNRNRNSSGNRSGGGQRRSSQGRRGPKKPPPKPTAWQKFVKFITFGAVDLTPSAKGRKKPSQSGKPKKKRTPQKVEPTSGRLYVGNLDYGVEDSDLSNAFAKAGTVVSASVVRHGGSNRSKGFAFVEMSSVEEAKKAVDTLNDLDLKGRKILVSGAKSERPEKETKPKKAREEKSRERRDTSRRDGKGKGRKGSKSDGDSDSRKVKVKDIEVVTSPFVHVSGLNGEAEEVDVSDLFDQVGKVESQEFVNVQEGAVTKEAKITFSATEEAQKAVEFLDGKSFMGHRLKVTGEAKDEWKPAEDAPAED